MTLGEEWYSKKTIETKRDTKMRLMHAAKAHKFASALCASTCHSYDIDLLHTVSFELTLVSVEQSLRTLSLWFFPDFPEELKHDLYSDYKKLRDKGPGEEWIRTNIAPRINDCAETEKISPISWEELIKCLKKHTSSYLSVKYFRVKGKGGKLYNKPLFTAREKLVLYCFAAALIEQNENMMIKEAAERALSLIEHETAED
ncbi:MAG: hypothetical protein F4X55_02390 [Candidatus Dadabacteria bacterium]|nr:hypothetical protein [Candidatus Dadabacteria bacterium]MYC39854.1 hypothetical protein [Candidatus Dadabacteria bacterium]